MSAERMSAYRMMGRNVQVRYDASKGAAILQEELAAYPPAAAPGGLDLVVRYAPVEYAGLRFANPSVHCEMEDGFVIKGRMATMRFRLEGDRLLGVDFYPASARSPLMRGVRRMADMQYTSREERAGVIFHEWVAGPAAYWAPDMALVHASSFSDARGVTLIGGTGGTGKTSLALELCRRHGFRFVADDISFVGEDGHVWPNLAWPKIYGYNLEGDPELTAPFAGRAHCGRPLALGVVPSPGGSFRSPPDGSRRPVRCVRQGGRSFIPVCHPDPRGPLGPPYFRPFSGPCSGDERTRDAGGICRVS